MLRERAATIGIKGPFLADLAKNLACAAYFAGFGVFQYKDIEIVGDDVFGTSESGGGALKLGRKRFFVGW